MNGSAERRNPGHAEHELQLGDGTQVGTSILRITKKR